MATTYKNVQAVAEAADGKGGLVFLCPMPVKASLLMADELVENGLPAAIVNRNLVNGEYLRLSAKARAKASGKASLDKQEYAKAIILAMEADLDEFTAKAVEGGDALHAHLLGIWRKANPGQGTVSVDEMRLIQAAWRAERKRVFGEATDTD